MKRIVILVLIISISLLIILSGCEIAQEDSEEIPQPPSLPDENTTTQQQVEDEIPQPPSLPEG